MPQTDLGRAVGWIERDAAGFTRLSYLLPERVTEEMFVSLPDAWVEYEPGRGGHRVMDAVLVVSGYRVWVKGTIGLRELTLTVEKPAGQSAWRVIRWFEEGLEELIGMPVVRSHHKRTPNLKLVA